MNIDRASPIIYIAENRRRTGIDHPPQRCDEGVRWNKYLIAAANIHRDHRQVKRRGAGIDADRMARSKIRSHFALERLDVWTETISAPREDVVKFAQHTGRYLAPLELRVVE